MQTNELHEFTGRGHGDLVGTLWGYLGQGTACSDSALPPTLKNFPPVPDFFAAFGCHRTPSSPNAGIIRVDVLPQHLLRSSLTGGSASCMVEVYHMAKDFMRPERVPYGSEETQETASTVQALLHLAYTSASDR